MADNWSEQYVNVLHENLKSLSNNRRSWAQSFLSIELFWRDKLPNIVNEIDSKVLYFYTGDPTPSEWFCKNLQKVKQSILIPDVFEKIKSVLIEKQISFDEAKDYIVRELASLEGNNNIAVPINLYVNYLCDSYEELLLRITDSMMVDIFQQTDSEKYDVNKLNCERVSWVKDLFYRGNAEGSVTDIIKKSQLFLSMKSFLPDETDNRLVIKCLKSAMMGPLDSFATMIIFNWVPIVENPNYLIMYSGMSHIVANDVRGKQLYVRLIAINLLMGPLNDQKKSIDLSKIERLNFEEWFCALNGEKNGLERFKQFLMLNT